MLSEDTSLPPRLLDFSLSFSEHPVIHCHSQVALGTGRAMTDKISMTEAGSLLLAQEDICYLGDLLKMKKDSLDYLTTGWLSRIILLKKIIFIGILAFYLQSWSEVR